MNTKKILLVTTCIAALPFAVTADDNWYVGMGIGGAYEHKAEFTRPTARNEADFDWGWTGEAALGYKYANGFRSEVEFSYKGGNDVDSISGTLTPNGDSRSWAAMVNVYYDLDMFDDTRFMPYVGVGAGVVRSEYDTLGPILGLGTQIDDTDTSFGYQGMAGLNIEASDMVDVYAQYKYMSAYNPTYDSFAMTDTDGDYDISTVTVGLRINFNEPAAPVAQPAAAPAPVADVSRTYIVFFDFNRDQLTPEARDVLKQAAVDAMNGGAIRVEVQGHADRSGSDSYNMGLSQRRAQSVASELARLGVPMNAIGAEARGERDPLVPTGDGVKEPQNRRAEIRYVK